MYKNKEVEHVCKGRHISWNSLVTLTSPLDFRSAVISAGVIKNSYFCRCRYLAVKISQITLTLKRQESDCVTTVPISSRRLEQFPWWSSKVNATIKMSRFRRGSCKPCCISVDASWRDKYNETILSVSNHALLIKNGWRSRLTRDDLYGGQWSKFAPGFDCALA